MNISQSSILSVSCPLQSMRWILRAQLKCLLVVMHSSNSPRPRDQDVRLPVPPDLPDNALPLLQTSRLLQLVSWREHVHAPQGAVGLAATITHGPHCHFRDPRLLFFLLPILLSNTLILLFLAGLLQLSPLGGRGRSAVAASPAGDAGHHEAQSHEQAETDAHHEVEGEALWVGCVGRETTITTLEYKNILANINFVPFYTFTH